MTQVEQMVAIVLQCSLDVFLETAEPHKGCKVPQRARARLSCDCWCRVYADDQRSLSICVCLHSWKL